MTSYKLFASLICNTVINATKEALGKSKEIEYSVIFWQLLLIILDFIPTLKKLKNIPMMK